MGRRLLSARTHDAKRGTTKLFTSEPGERERKKPEVEFQADAMAPTSFSPTRTRHAPRIAMQCDHEKKNKNENVQTLT